MDRLGFARGLNCGDLELESDIERIRIRCGMVCAPVHRPAGDNLSVISRCPVR